MSLLNDLLQGTPFEKTERIKTLKKNLANTDYKAIKFAEGFLSVEDYAETKILRQAWRDEINELEQ